jgi:hypothetical protein
MLRLVQLSHPEYGRRVAVVDEPKLQLLSGAGSVFELAKVAIASGQTLAKVVGTQASNELLDYDAIYAGHSEWSILSAFDHPSEPARCLVTGTGLTHRASAESRAAMHGASDALTDSMKMYRLGVEGGRPAPGQIGAQPEWFYKGTGSVLRGHGQPLDVPNFSGDGGEEAEIAGVYVIAPDGMPFRIGLVQGNEFSDHVGEARNYLYLAESKLRCCSMGPELLIPPEGFFSGEVLGQTTIRRRSEVIWTGKLASGEKWMCHTLANLEHHHFKNSFHRQPGDAHVHFLGADAFSFRDSIRLEDGDEMVISFDGFGRPLRNLIRIDAAKEQPTVVRQL